MATMSVMFGFDLRGANLDEEFEDDSPDVTPPPKAKPAEKKPEKMEVDLTSEQQQV